MRGRARSPGTSGSASSIYLYDANDVTLDGPASLTFIPRTSARAIAAYGWQVLQGRGRRHRSRRASNRAIAEARAETATAVAHHRPHDDRLRLAEEARARRRRTARRSATTRSPHQESARLGSRREVPSCPTRLSRSSGRRSRTGEGLDGEWNERFAGYERRIPSSPRSGSAAFAGELPAGWDAGLPRVQSRGEARDARGVGQGPERDRRARCPGSSAATPTSAARPRPRSRTAARSTAKPAPAATSTSASASTRWARSCNGMAYHGGVRPLLLDVLLFSDYMRPPVRLAALNQLPVDLRLDARLDRRSARTVRPTSRSST